MSGKDYLDQVNWGGKTHPNSGQLRVTGGNCKSHKKKKTSAVSTAFITLFLLTQDAERPTSLLKHLLPWLPHHDGPDPGTMNQRNPFLLDVFVPATRKVRQYVYSSIGTCYVSVQQYWSSRDLKTQQAGFERVPGYSWARQAHLTSLNNKVKRRKVMVVTMAQLEKSQCFGDKFLLGSPGCTKTCVHQTVCPAKCWDHRSEPPYSIE